MRLSRMLAVVTVSIAAAASTAAAQAPVTATPVSRAAPSSPAADSALRSMRTVLRQLAGAEEQYYVEHGTYTTDVSALGLLDMAGFRSGRTAWVAVSFAGGRGWSAEARHVRFKGKSCVDYVGDPANIVGGVPKTQGERKPAEQMGAPTCDAI